MGYQQSIDPVYQQVWDIDLHWSFEQFDQCNTQVGGLLLWWIVVPAMQMELSTIQLVTVVVTPRTHSCAARDKGIAHGVLLYEISENSKSIMFN